MRDESKMTLADVPSGEYMNEAQQLFFKSMLMAELQQVKRNIDERRSQIANPEKEPDEADLASMVESRYVLQSLLNHDHARLREISHALKIMAEGDYGYCEQTGEEIGVERLLCNPAAVLIFESKRHLETARKHIAA